MRMRPYAKVMRCSLKSWGGLGWKQNGAATMRRKSGSLHNPIKVRGNDKRILIDFGHGDSTMSWFLIADVHSIVTIQGGPPNT